MNEPVEQPGGPYIGAASGSLEEQPTEAVIVPLFSDVPPGDGAAAVDRALGGLISELREQQEFRAEPGDTAVVPTFGRLPAGRALLVGLGKRAEITPAAWGRAVSSACRALAARRLTRAALNLRDSGLDLAEAARAAALGAELARFVPDSYRTGERRRLPLAELLLLEATPVATAVTEGEVLGRAKNLARELVNEPGNVLPPLELARRARSGAEEAGLSCDILDIQRLEAERMGGILAVTRASADPACMIVLRHTPRPGPPALALVGKAVTFDTGGLSLKPRENMGAMKGDMAGGAAVIGAMLAIAGLGLPLNVVGVIPSAQNMPGGRAWRPGDVVTMRRGKTVETISTDAEGRMLLADALDYAQEMGAERLADIATLTGSCVVALGTVASGLFGNDADWIEAIRSAGEAAGERHWPMPLFQEYRSLNRSEIADLKNSAGRNGGAIGAAWFLREFVDDRPWAHLAIAGTARQEKDAAHAPAGPTGVGVGTFVELARRLAFD